jgi:hypothetical protein
MRVDLNKELEEENRARELVRRLAEAANKASCHAQVRRCVPGSSVGIYAPGGFEDCDAVIGDFVIYDLSKRVRRAGQ